MQRDQSVHGRAHVGAFQSLHLLGEDVQLVHRGYEQRGRHGATGYVASHLPYLRWLFWIGPLLLLVHLGLNREIDGPDADSIQTQYLQHQIVRMNGRSPPEHSTYNNNMALCY